MRVLFLTHRIPFPPNKGDKIRSFNILDFLNKRHEVFVGSLIDETQDLAFVSELQRRSKEFVYARIDSPLRRALALRSIVKGRPITLDHFYSTRLQEQIDRILDLHDIDVVLCYSSPMAEYVFRSRHAEGKLRQACKLMDLIDVDSYKWAQYARDSSFVKRWVYAREAAILGAYERLIANEFQHMFVVSDQERSYFPGGAPEHLHAIGNGVDLDFFSPAVDGASSSSSPTLVFTGVMDYWPNVEGVKWFAEEILPRIQASVPDVHLYVVGSRPAPEIRRLQSRNLTVTGFVQDVRTYLASAQVCVVPLRIARGVQNKVLESMAMGKAVVTTPQAHEGIQAESGREIVVARDEAGFAAAVIGLLQDPAQARQIGSAARECVERHYAWDRRLEPLEHFAQASR